MRATLSYGENETIRQDRKRTEEGQFKAKKTSTRTERDRQSTTGQDLSESETGSENLLMNEPVKREQGTDRGFTLPDPFALSGKARHERKTCTHSALWLSSTRLK